MVRDEENGRYLYEVRNERSDPPVVFLEEREMFHVKGPSPDGLMGYSVFEQAKNAIGLGLAAEQHIARWFGTGVHLSGTLTVPAALDAEARAELREEWQKMYASGSSFNFAILDNGAEWKQVDSSATPADAQNIENRRFQILEICRFFRVPPHKVFSLEDAKFANIEEQSLSYFRDTLLPWVTRLEEEADLKLLGENRLFTKFDIKSHMRGRMTDTANYYKTLSQLAALSPNEIRDDLDLEPIPDGDNYFLQAQYRTIDQIIEGEESNGLQERQTQETDEVGSDATDEN